ncbi:MAG: response regulator transcription factor [Blastocatellia bacterium]|nr:response regulator transcription factor [Blastocatellia bacterium]
MLASTAKKAAQPVVVANDKPRLLLVSDSADRLQSLKSYVAAADFNIDLVCSIRELRHACCQAYDLVALDAAPTNIIEMLGLIRGSEGNGEIPVLVECTRINTDKKLAGVLPNFRAMPCNSAEIQFLLRPQNGATKRTHSRRFML